MSEEKEIVNLSVRGLVEFMFRGGDITSGGSGVRDTDAMQMGSRIHRKIQKQMVKSDGKMSDIINEFLNNPSKKVIYELIDYIEIDENKNVKINFSFSSPV